MIKLNPQQKKATSHIEGPMIVLAGPGTGKTQIIAARIAHILENTQMDPHNILCLTFTESGVVAMRKRLIELIGTAAYYVRIHTFHSFCNEVIKDYPEKFLQARELESLTDVERIQIFRKILDSLPSSNPVTPFGAPYLYQSDLSHAIQNLKREDISPEKLESVLEQIESFIKAHGTEIEDFISTHANSLKNEDFDRIRKIFPDTPNNLEKKERTVVKNKIKKNYLQLKNQLPKQKALVQVYSAYQEELSARGRYDFEDMILFVVQKFKEDKELLAHYQEQFQYILVDEYQDTNGAQNEVVQLIGEFFSNPNIFVVGDDKQSIYRFQGASLENILYFYKLYKNDVQLVSLKENYRSQQTILDAAHSLIQQNEHGIASYIPELSEELTAAKDIPLSKVKIAEFSTPQSEHYFLAKKVQELIQAGTDPSEIAILYRNNWDARDLMDIFIRLEVPFRLEAKINILEDPQITKLLHLLEYLVDLDQDHLLFHILNFDFLNLKTLDVIKLSRYSRRKKRPFLDIMSDITALDDSGVSDPIAFFAIAEKFLSWQRLSINRPLTEFFDHVIKESGYLDHIMAQPDKVEQLNRLNTLFDEIKSQNRSNHELTLKDFLAQLDLLKENNVAVKEHELKTQKNAVRLMTAHKSKGLEFDYVFIMKCVDKHWGNNPNRSKIHLPKGLLAHDISTEKNEDERRLFYVAMTRAKKEVHISYSSTNENQRPQVPSIFIEELNPEYTEKIPTSSIEEEALDRLQTIFLKIPTPDHTDEEKAYIRSLLDNYTMSVTHLNNYIRCPRLFYYQNLLRVPSAMNKFAAFGSAVHETLKDFNIEHKEDEILPSKEFLLEKFEKHMRRQVMTKQDFRGGLDLGRETLSSYYDEYRDKFSPYSVSEYDFVSHGVNLDGIPITGKVDKINLIDPSEKEVHVIDYKTGNPDTKSQALAKDGEYWRQIVFYQLLCDLSPKFPYRMVSGEINFIQPSKRNNSFKSHKYEITHGEKELLKTQIRDVYDDIMNLKFLSPDEWTACGECEYCKSFN